MVDADATMPARVFQHCPRCGADGFAPQGEDRFRCGGCGFPYYINAAGAVAALLENEAGELLLAVRAREPYRGMLDLPGGFVDLGETAEAALAREVREELGLEVVEAEYLFSRPNRYPFEGLTYFTLDLAFRCRVRDWAPLQPADDVAEVVFLRPAAIELSRIGLPSIRAIVAAYQKRGS